MSDFDPDRVRMRALRLHDAILRMTIRYGQATQQYAYTLTDGSSPDERARRLRAVARRMKVMCRLTAALRDLPGGGR